jgi:hypothetical protein
MHYMPLYSRKLFNYTLRQWPEYPHTIGSLDSSYFAQFKLDEHIIHFMVIIHMYNKAIYVCGKETHLMLRRYHSEAKQLKINYSTKVLILF